MLENNFLGMSDRIGPLLPAAMDPAMSSCTSLNSVASFASITSTNEDHDNENNKGKRERGGLVDRRKKTNSEMRNRINLGSYKDHMQAGPLRRKASSAPTAWPRDSTTGKSNRDSLEMSLDAWNMDATKKTLMERAPQRKRESHIHHYTVTVPHSQATTSMLESPSDRRDDTHPFVLPPSSQSHVTPTKANAPSFFTAMFSTSNASTSSSHGHAPRTPGPRTPSSTSPARPSTVRRLARTLLEWNLGPQTDLSRWQRDSPRTPNNAHSNLNPMTPNYGGNPITPRTPHRTRRDREDEDDVMRTPD